MYRKILATAVTMFLLMTSLAYAANMQVNSSAQPVSGGTITPNGIKFYNAAATYTTAPKAGWTLTKVQIDGVDAVAPYTVPFDTSKIHTVKAFFAQTLSTFSLTATAGAGGTAIITGGGATNIKATDNRHVVVGPNTGYQIDTLLVDGSAVGAAVGSKVAYTVDFAPFGASNHTVAATFIKTPVAVNVSAGGNRTIGGTPAFSTTLSGSASVTPTTIQWNLVSGPAGSSFGTPTALSTTFTGTTLGTYVVSLTVNGTTSPNATITVADATNLTCTTCHAGSGAVVNLPVSPVHAANLCSSCHAGTHPAAAVCVSCHAGAAHPNSVNDCIVCHKTTDAVTKDAHGAADGCIDCHAIARDAGAQFVQDNNGVRAIMPEFTKRSHHITGGTPTNAQCAVCHLAGQVIDGTVHVNPAYHLKDAKIYLRNADDNTAFAWSGSEHTNMDNFCFSCHDNNGAQGLAAAGLNAATGGSNTNPFGDTLTNGYDQVARAGVVDVKTAFTTTNASHHAVSGQRYKYRFSTAANAAAWAARNSKTAPAASEIAVGNLDLDGNAIEFVEGEDSYEPAGPEKGGHATLFEADKFVATYIPLGAQENVGDNSTLHCGDCHTVGQWKAGSTTSANGSATTVAIGAHGSANDYLLRNSLGSDALHSSQTYVCFNCHTAGTVVAANDALWNELVADGEISSTVVKPTWKAGWNALHPNVIAGQVEGGYVTAHAVSAFHAQCQNDSSVWSGSGAGVAGAPSRITGNNGGGHKDRIFDFTPAAGATAAYPSSVSDSGNITGIACTNCHNSALRSGWGGIHGGDNTYTDGMGRSQKSYRFMPGMGNYRYAPPGGWDGKDVSDPRLVTLPGAGVGAGKPMGGCYTNAASGDTNPGFSSCSHHATSTAAIPAGIIAATPGGTRTTYGGGTASNATAAEPTVREATAGGTLVTRPLKY